MQCNNPIWLRDYDIHVPCGRCRACKIARAREWATRIVHETNSHENSCFITLTYDDENLPENEELDKEAMQKFIKRVRKQLGDRRIKYYASGEYGEKSGRPHYHAILFGIAPEERQLIQDTWPHGYIQIGNVTYDSARYVADYIQKKNYDKHTNEKQQPFAIMSNGLGRQFAETNAKQIRENLGITIRGVPVGLPKYYQKILEIDTEELLQRKEERLQELNKYYEEKYELGKIYDAVKRSRKQNEKNLERRSQLKSKGIF